jgi:hypothetical protein
MSAFYRYKRDQRDVLSTSKIKDKDFIKQQHEETENLKILLKG